MSLSSSDGLFAFAKQASGKGNFIDPSTSLSSFYRHRVISMNAGPVQQVGQTPLEVGGSWHIGGAYKVFSAGAGQVTMLPRLENSFGHLLEALCGAVKSTGTASTGSAGYKTQFRPASTMAAYPWLTFLSYVPGSDDRGDILKDGRVGAGQFVLAAGGQMQFQTQVMGLQTIGGATASDWPDMDHAYEDDGSIPVYHAGGAPTINAPSIDLGNGAGVDFEVPARQVAFSVGTSYSNDDPRNELIVGQEYPDDSVLVSQQLQITLTYVWENSKLFESIYYGEPDNTAFSITPFTTDFDLTVRSSEKIGDGIDQYYGMKFHAPEVVWQCGPPQLQGGGTVMLQLTGTPQRQTLPADLFYIELENATQYSGVVYS